MNKPSKNPDTPKSEKDTDLLQSESKLFALDENAIAVLSEVNFHVADFIQNYNEICSDYIQARMTAGRDLSKRIMAQETYAARRQLSAEFIEKTIKANLDCSEKMFTAYNALMAEMMSLITIRLK